MEGMIGEIRMFGGNFAPRNWATCEGQLLAISQNDALFSIVGTTYGGDGRTTFGLPDFRGRSAVGEGNGPGLSDIRLGQKGGVENNTLNVTTMPSHTHSITGTVNQQANNDSAGFTSDPSGKRLGASGNIYTNQSGDLVNMAPAVSNLQTANTGANQSINNLSPYTGINFVICLFGTYPSRS